MVFIKDVVKFIKCTRYISKNEEAKTNNYQKKDNENYFSVYTSICKKYYPCIIKPDDTKGYGCCFCFTCERHFCIEYQREEHLEHSFINFEQLKINEEDLIKEENSVTNKISLLFKSFLDNKENEKLYDTIKKIEDELIKFNIFIINSYRKEKNNFYNFFNFYYLFILKEDFKNTENNLLKKFFGLSGFKTLINDLKNHYEKIKILWIIKNLIEYKKYQIKKKVIKKRKENYNFENICALLTNEGYEDKIVNKMKEIINEVNIRKRDDYKNKIFNFIIESVDVFKIQPEKFLKELNIILNQVKINFKEMVKQTV